MITGVLALQAASIRISTCSVKSGSKGRKSPLPRIFARRAADHAGRRKHHDAQALNLTGMFPALKAFAKTHPVWAFCAGAILCQRSRASYPAVTRYHRNQSASQLYGSQSTRLKPRLRWRASKNVSMSTSFEPRGSNRSNLPWKCLQRPPTVRQYCCAGAVLGFAVCWLSSGTAPHCISTLRNSRLDHSTKRISLALVTEQCGAESLPLPWPHSVFTRPQIPQ